MVAEKTDSIYKTYKLIKKIGEGAYGTVYKALHKKSGETVAIKIMKKE